MCGLDNCHLWPFHDRGGHLELPVYNNVCMAAMLGGRNIQNVLH